MHSDETRPAACSPGDVIDSQYLDRDGVGAGPFAGELEVERSSAGHERAYHPGGQLRAEGDRRGSDEVDSRIGMWRFYGPDGLLRRVSEYDHSGDERTRTWHRTREEASGYGTTRRGPVADGVEVGQWEVSDEDGQTETVELGQPCRQADLMDGPAVADCESAQDLARVARQLEADDPGGPAAMLAWLRLAGRTADRTVVTTYVRSDRPWPEVDEASAFIADVVHQHGEDERVELSSAFLAGTELYVDAAEFLRHHDLVVRRYPLATCLVLSTAGNELRMILKLPALRRYSGLILMDTRLWSHGVGWLAQSPGLAGLTELGLANTGLDDDTLPVVLASTAYPRLRAIDLSDARVEQDWTLAGLAALPGAVFATTLERLMIGGRYRGDDVVEILAALPNLAELGLDRSCLTDGGLECLAGFNHRYRSVDLRDNDISVEGMVGFLESPVTTGLTHLYVGGNDLSDDGYAAAVTAASSAPLRHLDVSGGLRHRPGSATGVALGRATFVDTLTSLNLSLGHIGVDGSLALANAPWHCLESLNLYGNGIGDDGAVALAGAPSMARLRKLNLGDNQLTDRAGVALAQSPYLNSIHVLQLGGADLSDDTIAMLTNRFGEHVQFRYPWD